VGVFYKIILLSKFFLIHGLPLLLLLLFCLAKKVTKKGPQRNQLKRFLVAQANAAHAGIFQVRSSVGFQPHATVPVYMICIHSNMPSPLLLTNTYKWVYLKMGDSHKLTVCTFSMGVRLYSNVT
jgi:hypothetical protein